MRGAVADVLDQRESCEQTLSTPKRSFPSSADMSTLPLNSRDAWKRAPERVPEDGAGGCGSERAVGRLPGGDLERGINHQRHRSVLGEGAGEAQGVPDEKPSPSTAWVFLSSAWNHERSSNPARSGGHVAPTPQVCSREITETEPEKGTAS